jgi:hypothetical protein
MNGPHWLAYVWATAGCVVAAEFVWRSECVQKLSKVNKRIILSALFVSYAAVIFAVRVASGHQSIRLEIETNFLANPKTHKEFVGVLVRNGGWSLAHCNVYLTDLTKDRKTILGFTDTKIILATRNKGDGEFGPQPIPPHGKLYFELFLVVPAENKLLIFGDRLDQLPPPPSDAGEYVESIEVSGDNCGPVLRTYLIHYVGGTNVTVDEQHDPSETWLTRWMN